MVLILFEGGDSSTPTPLPERTSVQQVAEVPDWAPLCCMR